MRVTQRIDQGDRHKPKIGGSPPQGWKPFFCLPRRHAEGMAGPRSATHSSRRNKADQLCPSFAIPSPNSTKAYVQHRPRSAHQPQQEHRSSMLTFVQSAAPGTWALFLFRRTEAERQQQQGKSHRKSRKSARGTAKSTDRASDNASNKGAGLKRHQRPEQPISENSPFAALKELRDSLAARGRSGRG